MPPASADGPADVSTVPCGTEYPNGIWSDGGVAWVLDDAAEAVYAYATADWTTPQQPAQQSQPGHGSRCWREVLA